MSIGSLYQYFPNKDAFTIALIERETAKLIADINRAISKADLGDHARRNDGRGRGGKGGHPRHAIRT